MHNVEYTKNPVGRPRKIFRNKSSVEQIETTSSSHESNSQQVLSNQIFVSTNNCVWLFYCEQTIDLKFEWAQAWSQSDHAKAQ